MIVVIRESDEQNPAYSAGTPFFRENECSLEARSRIPPVNHVELGVAYSTHYARLPEQYYIKIRWTTQFSEYLRLEDDAVSEGECMLLSGSVL